MTRVLYNLRRVAPVLPVLLLSLLLNLLPGSLHGNLSRLKEERAKGSARLEQPVPVALFPDSLSRYPFLSLSHNGISDSTGVLNPFFEALSHLAVGTLGATEVLPVLHIGDSHLQPDILSGTLRTHLQTLFGNAGRGLVVPLRLAKTNQPADYTISSANVWKASRMIRSSERLQAGVGGNLLFTLNTRVALDLSLKNSSGNEAFSRISVFSSPNLKIWRGVVGRDTFLFRPSGLSRTLFQLSLPDTTSQIRLTAEKVPGRDSLFVYGMVLETGKSGILYHNSGSNGARMVDFTRTPLYFEQAAALDPRLLIVSLGTNEASGTGFTPEVFYDYLDNFCRKLEKACPGVPILLTTPLACGKRYVVNRRAQYRPNPNMQKVRDILVAYASERGFAVWDLFSAGGENTMENWYGAKLLSADRMHATREGYLLQGNLLYHALMTQYNRYVESRME